MKEKSKQFKVIIQYEYLKNYTDYKAVVVEAMSEEEAGEAGLNKFKSGLKLGSTFSNFKVIGVRETFIKEVAND